MSAAGVTDALVEAIASGDYDFIVANFANPDMVGHTGRLGRDDRRPSRRSTRCLGRVVAAVEARRRRATRPARARSSSITADHGNADELRDADGHPVTAHSLNPVPFVARRPGGRRAAAPRRRPGRRRADDPASSPACRAGTG